MTKFIQFDELEKELQTISVPKNELLNRRQQVIRQHRKEQRTRRRIWQTVGVAVLFCLAFVTGIPVSPAFANTVAKLPGFEQIVERIAYSKSVEDILANDYFEELMISETKNDLTLTVVGVIADETGMIVSYSLESPSDIAYLSMPEIELLHHNEGIKAGVSTKWAGRESTKSIQSEIIVTASEPINYINKDFMINMVFDDPHQTSFSIPFTLEKPIVPTKVYELNEVAVFEGQEILLKQLAISPLRAEVKMELAESNDMQILAIGAMKLLDENGEEWGAITSNVVGMGNLRDGNYSYFMESNYFREPKALTLVLEEVRALPKGKDFIEVDFSVSELVNNPSNASNIAVQKSGIEVISYRDEGNAQVRFDQVMDATGKEFYMSGQWWSQDDDYEKATYFYEVEDMQNPVKLYFGDYPHYLEGSLEISIYK